MQNKYFRADILFILFVTLAILVWLALNQRSAHLPQTPAQSQTGGLSVSGDGSQATTNVGGASLQSADPPASATTNTGVTPQQALPYTSQ